MMMCANGSLVISKTGRKRHDSPKLLALLDRVREIDQQGIIDQALLKKELIFIWPQQHKKPLAHAFVNIDHDGNEELLTLSPSVLVQA